MTMRLRPLALAVLVAAATLLGGGRGAAALDKVKMTIAAVSSNYAPFLNAIEQGYFQEEGMDVEIVHAGGGIATPALLSGQVDFSTSESSAFSAIMKGGPLKVILIEADRPTFQLWTTTDDLKTIASLKGKTVGIQTRGDTFEIWVRLVLKAHGMSGDDVSYTALGFGETARLATIKTGSLPAVVLSSLDVEMLRDAGVTFHGHLLEDAMKSNLRMVFNGVATRDALIKNNPDLVLRFTRATLKGMRFMVAYKDKTIDNLMKYNKSDRHSTEVDYSDVVKTLTKDGSVPPAIQQEEADIRADLIKLPKDKIPPLDRMFDFSFVRKANADLEAKHWKPKL
jgi:NitT/TauT family transport system substrate-binding protein